MNLTSKIKKLSLLMTVAAMVLFMLPAAPAAAAVPTAPSGLLAITINGGQVDLHWTDNSLDETGFNVERAPDVGGLGPGTYVHLGSTPTVGADVVTYSDTTVSAKQGYWYRVSAVNADGSSFPSNEVGIRMPMSSPTVSLSSAATLHSGATNTIQATAVSHGSAISGVEYQVVADNAAGVFIAKDVYAVQMDLTIPTPISGSPVSNTDPVASGLPAGTIVEYEIHGTVASVTGGEWSIGNPALTVYESASTKFPSSRVPHANDAVKIFAYRDAAGGPLVAKSITLMATSQPIAANANIVSYLYNGTVSAMTAPVTSAGYTISGEVWTIGSGDFRVDDPSFPAYLDPPIGVGTAVTVRFTDSAAATNVGVNIFNQITSAIQNPIDPNPVFDDTPLPMDIPTGAWYYIIVDGVVSGYDQVLGTFTVGEEGIKVYTEAATLIAPITVGDEILAYCRRTRTPGPLVAEQIHNILPGPLVRPYKETAYEIHYMYNGVIQSMGDNDWTVGGQTFSVDDPEGNARIDSMPFPNFNIGNPVTVEFMNNGEILPDAANWMPMTYDNGSGMWTANSTPPALTSDLNGTMYLKVTDALQSGSTTRVATTLQFLPVTAPTAPDGLNASVYSGNRVDLTWNDNSSDEDYFRIERAPDSGGNAGTWAILGTTAGPNTTSYSDTTVMPNTTYHYRVSSVNAYGPSLPSTEAMVTTTPVATKIAFTTMSRYLNTDAPSMVITVQAQDPDGNPANVSADTTVNLSSGSGTGAFDSSAGGTFDGSYNATTIANGTNSASFYYADTAAGTPTITATPAGLTSATQIETVVAAGVGTQLAITTSAQSIAADTASTVLTVELQDGTGTPANATTDATVSLSSSSTGGKFDTSSGGAFDGTVTSVVITNGTSSADFYYMDSMTGSPMLTVSAAGANSGMQTETITASPATKLAFTTQPSGAVAGQSFTTQPVVTVQDASGNTVTSYTDNVTVAITTNTGNAGATLSGTVEIPAVAGVATFTGLSIDLIGNNYTLDASSGALAGATSSAFNVVAATDTTSVSLQSGWNLISSPLIPADTARSVVLAGIESNINSIWAYDAATGIWSSWNPIIGGTLTTIIDGKGYWIDMNAADTLAFSGTALPAPPKLPPSYAASPGWNLIGFKNTTNKTAGEYLTGCDFRYTIWGFDQGAYVGVTNSSTNLVPGHGYWIYFNSASTITP